MTVGNQGRVLIVDDEMLIRQGIKHYINWEQEGFEIVGEAANGKEALDLIEISRPHIIITDIIMPIMDGEELTKIVKERYPDIEIIILSSFGEFDYVRSTLQCGAVDYILKPKLDALGLLKVLKMATSRIPVLQEFDSHRDHNLSIEQIINKLVSGYDINFDSINLSDTFPYSHYCLIGMELRSKNVEYPKYIKRKFESGLKFPYYSFTNQNRLVFLLNMDKEDVIEIINYTKQLAETEKDFGFSISPIFTDFGQIGIIYKESLVKLLNYRFYFPEMQLLMQENLPKQVPSFDLFNLEWFTSELKCKNFDSAFDYLNGHVLDLSSCYTLDEFEYKAFFGNIIFNILILLSNMGFDVKELAKEKYSYFNSIDEAITASEVVGKLNNFIGEAKKCINSLEYHPDNQIINKIMEFIKIHYSEPITLKDVAKHFHFNPSYLSSFFSANNNDGFIEYLNKIRIEEASKLLLQGTATISEISGMVGYSDQSYFCKVFKKNKGLSPSQYRRKKTIR